MTNLLDALAARLDTSFDRSGRAHATCPECGKEPYSRSGSRAFHFYIYSLANGKEGAQCHVCGYWASLAQLAKRLDVTGYTAPAPRVDEPPPPTPWSQPGALANYRTFQRRQWDRVVSAWQQYKPLNEATIEDADLGLGRLPLWGDWSRSWYAYSFDRLILPIFADGQVVGLRGRAIDPRDDGPKWLTASFSRSTLVGLESVQRGAAVVWCENLIDRLFAAQTEPSAVYVASGGGSWRADWLRDLAARRPRSVLVWFDNDLAGCPNAQTARAAAARRAAEGKPAMPEPRGPKLANDLLALGQHATVYRWPNGTPEHADLGAALMAYYERRAA